MTALLRIDELRVAFGRGREATTPLAGVTLEVGRGEVLGIVGETGCGKTLTGLSVLGLLPPGAVVAGGSIEFDGQDLLRLRGRELRALRGARIGMVFQNPGTAFNPVFTIGEQLGLVVREHLGLRGRTGRERVREALAEVGLPDPARAARSYPHQLSGGMLQRAMIAMALVCRPALLIADEPTTALDVTVQAEVLDLLRRLQREHGFAVLFVSHDLGVIARVADRVAVLYAGRVVETAATGTLLSTPHHPYTRGLLEALPGAASDGRRLRSIPGAVPRDPGQVTGCPFAARCAHVWDRCREERPAAAPVGEGHGSACHLPADVAAWPPVPVARASA